MKIEQKPVLLIICDISGYTRFMTENRESLVHSYVIVTTLMNAIIKRSRVPLRVSNLQGDAVFFYGELPDEMQARQRIVHGVLEILDNFFLAFNAKLAELGGSNICPCEACRNIDKLRLKIIMHSGEAVINRSGKNSDLSGVDVIIAHRLLKNSLSQDEYLLMTEASRREIAHCETTEYAEGEERYDELGAVKTFTYLPPVLTTHAPESAKACNYGSVVCKAKNILARVFQARLMRLKLKRPPHFHHIAGPEQDENVA